MVGKRARGVPLGVDLADRPVGVLPEGLGAVELEIGSSRGTKRDWVLGILVIAVPALVDTQLVRGPAKVEIGPGVVARVLDRPVKEISELVAGGGAMRRGLVGGVEKVKVGVTP